MSKKIIYLLSLLMALSLVFASCKKNGLNPNDVGGGVEQKPTNAAPDSNGGLYQTSDELTPYQDAPIINEELIASANKSYYRNPVIFAMGPKKSHLVVISEKRNETSGSINDIGINGYIATSIGYFESVNSGRSWVKKSDITTIAEEGKVNPDQTGATTGEKEKTGYAAPVVFKVDEKTLVVVVSSGGGIARQGSVYGTDTAENFKSKLYYAIGVLTGDGDNAKMTFSSKWKKIDDANIISKIGDAKYQFGTHAGKGYVVSKGGSSADLYLPVTIADQGTGTSVKEIMGNILLKATVNGTLNVDSTITWSVSGEAVKFSDVKNNYSKFKESIIVGGTGDNDLTYFAVGNASYGNYQLGKGTIGKNAQPSQTSITGSEGSPAFLSLEKGWYGKANYTPATYLSDNGGNKQAMFMHVTTPDYNLKFQFLNEDLNSVKGTSFDMILAPDTTAKDAKSSSMDVLGDGTIIMVAEQNYGTKDLRDYKLIIKRFTQYYLAAKAGI